LLITLTEFQRGFRKARETADRGDCAIVKGREKARRRLAEKNGHRRRRAA
jgi:hypothetical protein